MKRGEPTVYSFLTGPNSDSASSTQSTTLANVQDRQKLQNGDSQNQNVSQNNNSKSISQLYNQK
jgi:hypothetical protein